MLWFPQYAACYVCWTGGTPPSMLITGLGGRPRGPPAPLKLASISKWAFVYTQAMPTKDTQLPTDRCTGSGWGWAGGGKGGGVPLPSLQTPPRPAVRSHSVHNTISRTPTPLPSYTRVPRGCPCCEGRPGIQRLGMWLISLGREGGRGGVACMYGIMFGDVRRCS